MKRTPWFPDAVNPVRPGRYEVRVRWLPRNIYANDWDGERWLKPCIDFEWRGLAEPDPFAVAIAYLRNTPERPDARNPAAVDSYPGKVKK